MLPRLKTPIPGPKSRALMRRLRRVECPHITYADAYGPIFIESASGTSVTDADGNRLLDFTSFFAVSSLGHAAPAVARAARAAIARGWHAMGDVHPPRLKVELAERLASVLPKGLTQCILSSSGSEAVESALKTAVLATGRPGVVAFEGAYHGLGYGAMQATHRRYFRAPFMRQVLGIVHFAPFAAEGSAQLAVAAALDRARRLVRAHRAGAILIEPVQGRGGVRAADPRFLAGLRRIAREERALLIFDEVFTGFGRTGKWFACEHSGVVPDLITLGKAMSNGFPISACAGTERAMRAWGPSEGEARHTSTFLGNPLGCAMACATIDEMRRTHAPERARKTGEALGRELESLRRAFPRLVKDARGKGLMWGLEFRDPARAAAAVRAALKAGILLLGSGPRGETLSFTPPFTITAAEIRFAGSALRRILGRLR